MAFRWKAILPLDRGLGGRRTLNPKMYLWVGGWEFTVKWGLAPHRFTEGAKSLYDGNPKP